jgi:4-amino-4-deoxy-L-arabinose transferase-like glycosyltransferase
VNINAPIIGVHSWRQADTAALARNFYQNHLPIWLPQVDWGGVSSGYAETDFPIYSYGVSKLYQFFGLHESLARGLSLICSLAALLLLQRFSSRLFGVKAGWWGALFFAVLPLSVFYGRSVQPEALLMLASALTLERGLAWQQMGGNINLALTGFGLTLASLIKVLPLFWLGLPLLWLCWRRWQLWLVGILALIATVAWYYHAHHLYLETGLSFGFWGTKAARYGWIDLLNWRYWGDILLRFSLRGLGILGLPLLIWGLWLPKKGMEEKILPIGLGAVLVAGAIAPSSSYIHEYYQLPLLLFACPILGKAMQNFQENSNQIQRRALVIGFTLLLITSLAVLRFDYWNKENIAKNPTWLQAQQIKAKTLNEQPLISVTAGDPTLLYLSERKGWLVSPDSLDATLLNQLKQEGASAVVGSWERIENYSPFLDGQSKQKLANLLLGKNKSKPKGDYVIPLKPL